MNLCVVQLALQENMAKERSHISAIVSKLMIRIHRDSRVYTMQTQHTPTNFAILSTIQSETFLSSIFFSTTVCTQQISVISLESCFTATYKEPKEGKKDLQFHSISRYLFRKL